MIKKLLWRAAFAAGTIGTIVAGSAAFSAFEAHVVNVTATINNALTVPQETGGISFGNIFPEQVAHMPLDISLSDSFSKESRVDDVSYMIRQKPKCGILAVDSNPAHPTYTGFAQVTDGPDGQFVCPAGSVALPLLCPYLSKHSEVLSTDPLTYEDGNIESFHGPITGWTLADSISTQVLGHLSKQEGDTSDHWDIDLHAPCFKGMCAQDNVIPANYQPDQSLEGQTFGCDLWVEINGISLPSDHLAHLNVIKHVVNTGGGTAVAGDFTMHITNSSSTPASFPGSEAGTSVTVTAGAYSVTETGLAGYTESDGLNCSGTIVAGTTVECIITNTFIQPTTGGLTVTKVVVGTSTPASSFNLFVDGSSVTSAVATTTSAGSHVVSEGSHAGFTSVIGGANCDSSGNVTVPAGGSASCTVTNTFDTGSVIVHKVVVTTVPGTTTTAGDFQMTLDGSNIAQDATTTVASGNHTVGEVANPNYTASFSGNCPGGVINVPVGQTVTCTVTNTQRSAKLTINKVVVNTHNGNNVASDFSLFASGDDATTQLTNGVQSTVAVGTLFINENGVTGYQAAFSGDCDSSGQITLAAGDVKQCTITNSDIAPSITLIKVVDAGGASPASFALRVDGTLAPQNSSVSTTSNTAHTIDEDAHANYHFVSMVKTAGSGSATCPAVLGGTVTLAEGETITCTVHNTINP